MTRLARLLSLLCVLLLGATAALASPPAGPRAASTDARAPADTPVTPVAPLYVGVQPVAKAQPLAPGFVGLSLEYRTVLTYAGTNPAAVNPVFVHLLQALAPGQSPVLRIGGDSTDWSWWPTPRIPQPPGVTYAITPQWLASAAALARQTDARYILGVNLEAGSGIVERTEARALLNGLGWHYVQAVELGNEPELYSVLPWYKTLTGVRVRGRPASYNFQSYVNELSAFHAAEPWIPLAGPSSGSYGWLSNLAGYLTTEPWLKLVTVHSYWLNKCVGKADRLSYPTVSHLLDPNPPSALTANLASYATIAHAHGLPIRIDEMNSVTCGGSPGVSDVFASALWALNALLEAAGDGIDGVNIHTFPGTANQLFSFVEKAGAWSARVRPEYYGLLMFSQAMPPGSTLLQIAEPATEPLRAWAALDSSGNMRVVLINSSPTVPRTVQIVLPPQAQLAGLLKPGVSAPSPDQPAQLEQLTAPSVYAKSGITLGGQTFGPSTTTGVLPGPAATTTVAPAAGAYTVTVPPASATLLTIASPASAVAPAVRSAAGG